MLFSINWLNDYTPITISADALAEKLTLAGFEVDGLIPIGESLHQITTGKITAIEKHPNADKLVITKIFDGTNTHQIVTGATNIALNDIVPVSLPGSILANGLKIKISKLRGVDSYGMLCSEVELGLADEAPGVWVLPTDTPLGIDFIKYASLKDTLLDISILPNRGDCLSIFGLAREISVILDTPLTPPPSKIETSTTCNIDIQIQAKNECPLYTGRRIQGITQTNTPLWMKQRLQISGIRPIRLAVDITNYVLLELGQPMHAFDSSLIKNNKIAIRLATNKEKIQTLDNQTHTLDKTALLICDDNTPIALAGIMGGMSTEIKENTTDIFLESAAFLATNIRRTASKNGLRTESSIRFEKGIDINNVATASDRACYLYQTLMEAEIISTIKTEKNNTHPYFEKKTLLFSDEKINQLLGTHFSKEEMQNILAKLGFKIQKNQIQAPSWRSQDIQELPCIAEEIARIKGYDHIVATLPLSNIPVEPQTRLKDIESTIQNSLIHHGLMQCITFPMIAPSDTKKMTADSNTTLQIQNPLSKEESVMRPSLLPSLLKCLDYNLKRQNEDITLFEIGKTYHIDNQIIQENQCCMAVLTGQIWHQPFQNEDKKNIDIQYIKGLTENTLTLCGINDITYQQSTAPYLHPTESLTIMAKNKPLGDIGLLHPNLAKQYDIDIAAYIISIDITALTTLEKKQTIYQPIAKFPSTRRDIALLAPKSIDYQQIYDTISKIKPKTVTEQFLFDRFESESLGKDNVSLGIGLIYQAKDKTLSDKEVNDMHNTLIKKLTKKLPVTIR